VARSVLEAGARLVVARLVLETGARLVVATSVLEAGARLVVARPVLEEGARLVVARPVLEEGARLVVARPVLEEGARLVVARPVLEEGARLVVARPVLEAGCGPLDVAKAVVRRVVPRPELVDAWDVLVCAILLELSGLPEVAGILVVIPAVLLVVGLAVVVVLVDGGMMSKVATGAGPGKNARILPSGTVPSTAIDLTIIWICTLCSTNVTLVVCVLIPIPPAIGPHWTVMVPAVASSSDAVKKLSP